MRGWVRKSLLLVALLLALAALLSGVGVAMFKGTPEGYGSGVATSEAERNRLARDAENKLIEAQNWAATLRADEERAARQQGGRATGAAAATTPAPRAQGTYLVEFSQHELNALFDKWSAAYDWRGQYAEFVSNPQVVLRDGKLVLAAGVPSLGAIASFHFRPQIDPASGGLRLDLERVAAGRLPLPESIWSKWRSGVVEALERKMPRWRAEARIDPSGAANFPAMAATLSRLLFAVAEKKPADPVLFFPLAGKGSASVSVKITSVEIADQALKLRVQPLAPAERSALLERIRR